MSNRYGDFDDPDDGFFTGIIESFNRAIRMRGRGSLLTFMTVLFMIAALVTVLWYSYPKGSSDNNGTTVPMIRADNRDFRQEPENRGGMQLPNRDSTIFETIREPESENGERVENLLEDNERPLPRSKLLGLSDETNTGSTNSAESLFETPTQQAPAHVEGEMPPPPQTIANNTGESSNIVNKVINEQSNDISEPLKSAPPAMPEIAKKIEEPVAAPKVAEVKEVKKEESILKDTAKKVADIEPAAPAISSGNFFVQLASVKSRDAADSSWPGIKSKYSILSNSQYRVQEAIVGEKGTFYRIQAGPYSKEDAKRICDDIKSQSPGGCLVVAR